MPRYFFDIRDGQELAVDAAGMELKDLKIAQEEAAKWLADMVRDAVRSFSFPAGKHYMGIEVRADSGPVMQVKFTFEIAKLMD